MCSLKLRTQNSQSSTFLSFKPKSWSSLTLSFIIINTWLHHSASFHTTQHKTYLLLLTRDWNSNPSYLEKKSITETKKVLKHKPPYLKNLNMKPKQSLVSPNSSFFFLVIFFCNLFYKSKVHSLSHKILLRHSLLCKYDKYVWKKKRGTHELKIVDLITSFISF